MTSPLVSPHFSLWELTRTDHRAFMAQQSDPPAQVRANLVRLCADLLEPARALVGRLRVNSGYRCPALNSAIGGSKTSAHMDGLAADIWPLDVAVTTAFATLAESGLPLDQIIIEKAGPSVWIHLGAARHGVKPRGQRLAMYGKGYTQWDPQDERFKEIA
jgi:zinc D-Ala-D-Ala carboxypeptidase